MFNKIRSEVWKRSIKNVELILQAFRSFTYVTAHSPTLPLLHLRHSSFSNPSFASPTSQDFHLRQLASRPWGVETFSEVPHHSHGYSWCYLRATACLRSNRCNALRRLPFVSAFTGVRQSMWFLLQCWSCGAYWITHLKIDGWAGNECERPAEWRLRSLHSWKSLYDETALFTR